MKQTVIVYGAGTMGAGIAASGAVHGHPVVLVDTDMQKAHDGLLRASGNIEQLLRAGLISHDSADQGVKLLTADTDITKHLDTACLVIEAVYENLETKRNVFRYLDETVPEHIIITSNTSGMMLKSITQGINHPERTAITHFWFPGHLLPLVEIVQGEHTSEETVVWVKELLTSWGKAPVIVRKDLPGQLANRILQAIIRESIHIVEQGLASPEDVDTAIKMGMAVRFPAWGPLEHIDAVGLDLALSVQKDVLPEISGSTTPGKMLSNLVSEGNLGHKSGNGFYNWAVKDMTALAARRDDCIIHILKQIKKEPSA